MFGRMMNNYYYGKSGKGDFRKDDMPETRMQLFWDTLRTRFSGLCRLNLLYMLIFLPAMVVLLLSFTNMLSTISSVLAIKEGTYETYIATAQENKVENPLTQEEFDELQKAEFNMANYLDSSIFTCLLWLIPCIAITGPFTAGLCYVTRNWARDEHAFAVSDFKDAVKANWKQALGLSAITSILPAAVYVGWKFYGEQAAQSPIMIVPQVLVMLVSVIWALSITYMHPLAVTYELRFIDVIRNGLLLGVARLPMSVGIRLLHCVPALLAAAAAWLWDPMMAMLILMGYYVLIGFGLSRFITASYTNAVFDKYINSRIEGAKVNQGLREEDSDDDEPEEEDLEEPAKAIPGENTER